MDEVIKTTLLEYEKSTFLIDLVKHSSGKLYISIEHKIIDEGNKSKSQTIRINPSILEEFVNTLKEYGGELPKEQKGIKGYFPLEKRKEIVNRYLKGLEIDELVMQFNSTKTIIEQILRNSGLEIMSNKMPKDRRFRRKRRR